MAGFSVVLRRVRIISISLLEGLVSECWLLLLRLEREREDRVTSERAIRGVECRRRVVEFRNGIYQCFLGYGVFALEYGRQLGE